MSDRPSIRSASIVEWLRGCNFCSAGCFYHNFDVCLCPGTRPTINHYSYLGTRNTNSYTRPGSIPYSYAYPGSNSYSYTYPGPNPYSYPCPYSYTHPYPGSNPYSYTYPGSARSFYVERFDKPCDCRGVDICDVG